jgi:hypothetical protein
MRVYARRELSWHDAGWAWALHCGRRGAVLHIAPDAVYPGMWRVKRADGGLSDIVNLTWARDGAAAIALQALNRGREGQPMKPSTTKRLEALEEAADIGPRVHWIWVDEGEGESDVEAEIAARLAAGTAKAGDRFCTISWRPPDPRYAP